MAEFDQDFEDAIQSEVCKHMPACDTIRITDERMARHTFPEWFDGWDAACEVAARLSAARQKAGGEDESTRST